MGEDSREWSSLGGAVAASLAPLPFAPGRAAAITEAKRRVTPEMVNELEKGCVGGPLYPPVHAFVMAPLALENDVRSAYRQFQAMSLGLAYFAALGVAVLSRGGIPWSIASIAVLLYPGCRSCLDLGQNALLTLTIVIWGWALASRGRPLAGGAVW